MTFQQKFDAIVSKHNSLLCVGLDSDRSQLPLIYEGNPDAQLLFNQEIIEATHDLVCSYKLNSAFYEGQGARGVEQLKQTCEYLYQTYPEVTVILDAKRGDIGSTNNGYEEYAFTYLGVDAITLHPYLGKEALQHFLNQKDKGIIILCRTSNPGAGELQDLSVDGVPLYQKIAQNVSRNWNANGNCLLVVGATYPEELAAVRKIVGEMTLLIPGIGAQGGDVEKTVKAGLNSKKAGMLISSSRGIIFASNGADFAEKAREEAEKLKKEINLYRTTGGI